MKKFLSVLLCLMIVVCSFSFVGCGSAVFNGNYNTKLTDELTAEISKEYGKLEKAPSVVKYDEASKTTSFAGMIDGDFTLSAAYKKYSANLDFDATVALNSKLTTPDEGDPTGEFTALLKGGVKLALKGNETIADDAQDNDLIPIAAKKVMNVFDGEELSVNGDIYFGKVDNANYLYVGEQFKMLGIAEGKEGMKVDTTKLAEDVIYFNPAMLSNEVLDAVKDLDKVSLAEIATYLNKAQKEIPLGLETKLNLGLDIKLDISNGYKFKVVATDATFDALANLVGEDYLKFDTKKLEAYVAFNSDMSFAVAKVIADVKANVNNKIANKDLDGTNITVAFKGELSFVGGDVKIEVPGALKSAKDITSLLELALLAK